MYEIGNAYWLYYDPHTEGKALQENELEKDRIMVSYEWLEKAVGDPHFAETDPDDVISARVCQTLCSLISRYSPKFRQVGIKKDQQAVILDRIEGKILRDGTITYRNKYSVGIAEQIDVDAVRLKLSMAYEE